MASRPDVLITAVPQPEGSDVHLDNVAPEADAVAAAYGSRAETLLDISFADLDAALAGRTTWCFAGHGDALLAGELVPAFVKDGEVESVSLRALAETVRRHAVDGRLRLVVLTGCKTLALGRALLEQACVPCVVCWNSVLEDEAGRLFGTAFANATAAGDEPRDAFDAACRAVESSTTPAGGRAPRNAGPPSAASPSSHR